MLKPVTARQLKSARSFAIIASQYNARYVDAMVRSAKAVLKKAGAKKVRVWRVPGAYEIPVVAARLANPPRSGSNSTKVEKRLGAIICLGVILRGETEHASLIGEAVTRALTEIQIRHGVPVIHEVLLLESEAQAKVRCLGKKHNRGTEAAQTAVAMARLMESLDLALR